MTAPPVWRVLSAAGPGRFDGIGDFASSLTEALRGFGAAELFVRQESWAELEQIDVASTAGVIVQYYPQAFLRGDLRRMLRWLDRVRAAGRPVVLTVHEYWPPLDGTVRRAAVRLLFRRMLRACIRRSTSVVASQERSAHELALVARGHQVLAIPVGSSIPRVDAPRTPGSGLVMFGQPAAMHAPTVAAVAAWLETAAAGVTLTWLGRSTDEMRRRWCDDWHLPTTRVNFAGGLPAVAVSSALARARIGLAPYENGASTRRTTFAAMLQHGLPVVALDGITTADWLRESGACVWTPEGQPSAFVAALASLADDEARQRSLSTRAETVFETRMSWPVIGAAYARLLTNDSRGATA
jgi:glycosyltransferase involved in cell wall biosynthesis